MDEAATRNRRWDRSLVGDLLLAGGGTALLVYVLLIVFTKPAVGSAQAASSLQAGRVDSVVNAGQRRSESELFWRPLQSGDAVYDRDRVYAAAGSAVQLVLEDETRLTVEENSLVIVSRPANQGGLSLAPLLIDVQRGAVSGVAGNSGASIRSHGAQVALSAGAAARLRLRADQSTSIAVGPGRATVTTEDGTAAALEPGHLQEVSASGRAGAAQRIEIALAQPAHGGQLYFVHSPPAVEFSWSGCGEGNGAYRLEVSRDPDFTQPARKVEVGGTSATLRDLPAGISHWRVRRPRAAGECRSEERTLALVADVAPIMIQPRHGEIVYQLAGSALPFVWSEVAGVRHYIVELRQADAVVANAKVEGASYAHGTLLAEGRYCAQVRASEVERDESPWSSRVCFRVINKPLPRAPKLFDPQIEDVGPDAGQRDARLGDLLWRLIGGVAHAEAAARRAIVLRWEAVPGVNAYIIEIAEDAQFKNIVVHTKVPQNYFKWATLAQRTYHWRVKSVDAEGRESEFSEVRTISAVVGAPDPTAPRNGATFSIGDEPVRVALRWSGAELVVQYDVEVARDAVFSDVAGRGRIRDALGHSFTPDRPGSYYWRVTGIDANGERTGTSPVQRFDVDVAAPRAKRPAEREEFEWGVEEPKVQLRWSERPVARYEVQLARSQDFTKVMTSQPSNQPALTVKPLGMGKQFWRVRGLEPETPWSKPASFNVVPAAPASIAATQPASAAIAATQAASRPVVSATTRPAVAATRPAVAATGPTAAARAPSLHAGPQAAFFYNLGQVVTGRAGLELGYRLPLLDQHFGLTLSASYFPSHATASDPARTITADSWLHAIPIELLGLYFQPLGPIRLYGGLGPALNITYATVSVPGQPTLTQTGANIGLELAGGLEWPLGPGALFGDLRYVLSTGNSGLVEINPGGLLVGLGYRLWIL